MYFYPRPPRGGRPGHNFCAQVQPVISIHVPRVGDDAIQYAYQGFAKEFLSTSPAWGTTRLEQQVRAMQQFLSTSPAWGTTSTLEEYGPEKIISIHVPRVGDDQTIADKVQGAAAFLSTSPAWGTTVVAFRNPHTHAVFLSTSPAWGTTFFVFFHAIVKIFLSTSPAWGTTPSVVNSFFSGNEFLSTSPAWGTTQLLPSICYLHRDFYPRPPRGGRRHTRTTARPLTKYFYPRPPRGGRHVQPFGAALGVNISIHVPRVGDDAVWGWSL